MPHQRLPAVDDAGLAETLATHNSHRLLKILQADWAGDFLLETVQGVCSSNRTSEGSKEANFGFVQSSGLLPPETR